jgi:AcrR family transcriptional regulator
MMRRKEIIDAARTVFARKGFNDAKLEDVAELAEFGKGTLYNYFDNKEALFKSVLEDSFETIKGIAVEVMGSDKPFAEKIEDFVRAELSFLFGNLDVVELMMRESHHLRNGNPLMQMIPQLLKIVADTISAEQKSQKILPTAEPMALATMLFNMLLGQFSCRVYVRIDRDAGQICEEPSAAEANGAAPRMIGLQQLFADMSREQIQSEIETATGLIKTVFFHGILR